MAKNREKVAKMKNDFYKLAGFPGVIGYIDGSHISIVAPHEDEFVFINYGCGIANICTNYVGRTIICNIFSSIVTSIAKKLVPGIPLVSGAA